MGLGRPLRECSVDVWHFARLHDVHMLVLGRVVILWRRERIFLEIIRPIELPTKTCIHFRKPKFRCFGGQLTLGYTGHLIMTVAIIILCLCFVFMLGDRWRRGVGTKKVPIKAYLRGSNFTSGFWWCLFRLRVALRFLFALVSKISFILHELRLVLFHQILHVSRLSIGDTMVHK